MASQSIIEQGYEYLKDVWAAEESFYEFVKQAWPIVEGNIKFVDGWHIRDVCEHLQACYYREIMRILFNIPPRCMKTLLCLILFPAWVFIKNPSERFFTSSYSQALSEEASRRCKELIMDDWYQERWGHLFQIASDQRKKGNFSTTQKGAYIATSTNGTATGRGGTFLICDDPNNIQHSESEARRKEAKRWFDGTWATRGNDPKRTVRIVIQQRVDENDISSHIIDNDDENSWVKVILPMEFESERRAKTIILPHTNGKVWQDPRKEEGELLWPQHMDKEAVRILKRDLRNPSRIAGQLQQRPRPPEGDLIKRHWFKWWKQPQSPEVIQTIQSWDTAFSDSDTACYSACTTWGLFYDNKDKLNLILLSAYRERLNYHELRSIAKKLAVDYRDDGTHQIVPDGKHKSDYVLIENKATGIILIQDFIRAGIPAVAFNPAGQDGRRYGNKEVRVQLVSHLLEAGRVWVPAKPPYYENLYPKAHEFVESAISFPGERDFVDSMVQVLLKLESNAILMHPEDDEIDNKNYRWLNKSIY